MSLPITSVPVISFTNADLIASCASIIVINFGGDTIYIFLSPDYITGLGKQVAAIGLRQII